MKIALPHCGFSPESNSGGETYEREVLKHLAKLGVEFEIILAEGKPYPQGFPQFHIHRVPIRKGLRWYVSNFIWPHYLKKIESQIPFDLLRIHSLRYTGPGVLWFNKHAKRRYPVVCHHHHIDPDPLNYLIEKRVINASDLLITGSEFSKKQLIADFSIKSEKIKVVPYGVDESFKPMNRDRALLKQFNLSHEKVLLFLGGFKKRKKIFFLIDVFDEVLKHVKYPVKLVMAGSGPLKNSLTNYIQQKGLSERVILTGYIPEQEKTVFHNLADIFVFPSEMEGFGFSPAEASACAKPVILSNVGSLPEIVEDGKTGFVLENDVRAFSEKILWLLSHPEESKRMGEAGLKRAKFLFQWEITAKKTLSVYEEVVKNVS
ncbi:MAG: hypothetical protein COV74_09215 [Candidatus Omnitrophica bacterium CG11_big_fil_rev_8_21_14_0_20_45_26]|uniref:Glycosyl transferase family 1 n=1 Tax=Candidatus Abzuiibacterium crystallinum TaxID=1974748 RepID=A0A2H0LLW3_9BACT|nr:MAG: hypothetical protein COV74_09215 [Candidatus Omnitrophica bacterium CG11_big_fil_rev_8_21_14_0_20_45_26]PIW63250.1 MAG: hypothetical protein COW12_11190 [Candidatus Omnitrophica bacterium CG12_big_fil_rev_8_21_14_0_65_45_16]